MTAAEENRSQTISHPILVLPPPPEYQTGDNDEVGTTIGAMRMALYYYRMYPLLIEHINSLNTFALEEAEKTDVMRSALQQRLHQCDTNRRTWKTTALFFITVSGVFITVTVIQSIGE